MKTGGVYTSPTLAKLEVLPHELKICGYIATQTTVLAHLLVQFAEALKIQKVESRVIDNAFKQAAKLLKEK